MFTLELTEDEKSMSLLALKNLRYDIDKKIDNEKNKVMLDEYIKHYDIVENIIEKFQNNK